MFGSEALDLAVELVQRPREQGCSDRRQSGMAGDQLVLRQERVNPRALESGLISLSDLSLHFCAGGIR